MVRVIVLGSEADRGLARLLRLLAVAEVETALYDPSPAGAAVYAVGGTRTEGVLFDANGLPQELFRRLRARHHDRVWIAWTSRYSSARAAALLEAGAHEVLNDSMGDEELVARVLTALDARPGGSRDVIVAGRLEIDPGSERTTWEGRELELTRRETELLCVLARSPGRTVRREALYREVWGFAMARGDRTVDVNVKRLRAKLAAGGAGIQITTRPGVGYGLEVLERPAELLVTEL